MKIRKKLQRLMAMALSATLCAAMLPTAAFAADTAEPSTPYLTDLAIGSDSRSSLANGILVFGMPSDDLVTGQSVTLTTSEEVTLTATSSTSTGSQLYVVSTTDSDSATLALSSGSFALTIPVTRSESDGTVWSGTAASDYSLNMETLATASGGTLTIPAGTMTTSDGVSNVAQTIYVNQDNVNTYLVIADSTITTATVTYHVGDSTFTMTMPVGAPLIGAEVTLSSNQTWNGWTSDSEGTTIVSFDNATVTGDMDLYASITTTGSDDSGSTEDRTLEKQIEDGETNLTIRDLTDWEYFVDNASELSSSCLVTLATDIDCGSASYTAITYAGSFNGDGHTISNATFGASGDYCGMFATIGADQVVANLTLDNITAKKSGLLSYATYAGALAGSLYGSEGHRAIVQNVSTVNCTVTGRSAGGLVGFTIYGHIQYCSTTSGSITGIVNAGGIAGLSYSNINDCYSTISATAAYSGGITGKDLESGYITHCWCTKSSISGSTDSCTEVENLAGVTSSTTAGAFEGQNFDEEIWDIQGDLNTTLNASEIQYDFN